MIIRQAEIQKFGKLEKGAVSFFPADQYHLWSERIWKKYLNAVSEGDDVWVGEKPGSKNAGYL